MFSLPLIAETQFRDFISGRYSGSYEIHNAFSLSQYSLPLIGIGAGNFKEAEPFTHVYDGELTISILTQIDDVADPVAIHDETVAAVYDIMSSSAVVQSGVAAANFHLWQYYSTNYDQGKTQVGGFDALGTHFTFHITCQNSGVA